MGHKVIKLWYGFRLFFWFHLTLLNTEPLNAMGAVLRLFCFAVKVLLNTESIEFSILGKIDIGLFWAVLFFFKAAAASNL